MKSVTHIDCPERWLSNNDWDSHRPALWLACENTENKIIEAGMGHGSTKLIRSFGGREIEHYDNNKQWIKDLSEDYFYSEFVTDWLEDGLFGNNIGLLFVDLAPGEVRKDVIEKYKEDANVIVVHDTEPGANYVYRMADVLSTFKYRLDYTPEGKPHTSIVSNFVNVEEWVN